MKQLIDRYLVADARKALLLLPDESIDLIVTDPPYGIHYISKRYKGRAAIKNDRRGQAALLLRSVIVELERVLKPGAAIFMFAPGGKTAYFQGAALAKELKTAFEIRNTLVWDKIHIGPGIYFRTQYECIVHASKGPLKKWRGARHSQMC